jgi:hypothetical protein
MDRCIIDCGSGSLTIRLVHFRNSFDIFYRMRPLDARLYKVNVEVDWVLLSYRMICRWSHDFLHAGFAISIIGRRWARIYMSCSLGSASDRMTLPMDMKKPKVAPEPAMYWPRVLMMPLGPAPYRKMLTVPEYC